MLSSEFAFSSQMQTVLFFVSCSTTFLFYYLITNIILKIYSEKASLGRRLLFVSICGLFLNNLWTYGIYFIGGMMSFSPTVYLFVTVPNPLFAMVIYYSGVKVLGLSQYRSVHIMNHTYIYYIAIKLFNRFIGFTFFTQAAGPYNYLLDALSLVCCAAINVLIYFVTIKAVGRFHFVIQQGDQLHVKSLFRELALSFLKACFVYALAIFLPRIVQENTIHLLISFILVLLMINGILSDARKASALDASNKDTYINNLVESVDRIRGVKHDINNMLMTYEGYIALGDLDSLRRHHNSLLQITDHANVRVELAERIKENPALVSLINAKLDYAEANAVSMDVDIHCNLDLHIDNMDICRSIANLLDNAIEAAALSPQRKVLLTIERKPDDTRLIIVKNSTLDAVDVSKLSRGVTTKQGHSGLGVAQVRKTLGKYGNCSFHLSHFDSSFTAYIAITPMTAY